MHSVTTTDAMQRRRRPRPSSDAESSGLPNLSKTYSATLPTASTTFYREQVESTYTPRAHHFESVDFRTPSSQLNSEALHPRSAKDEKVRLLRAHLMVVCIGFVVGVLAFGIDQAAKWCQIGIYSLTDRLVETSGRALGAVAFISLSALCLSFSASICVFWSPVAAGSGIPEMKSYLNGVYVPGLLGMQTLIAKSAALVLALGGGILSGKQGPLNHIGAIVGAAVSQGASSQFRFRVHSASYRPFRTEESKRDFAAIGSAIGASVAFGAPLGATLWALEEAVTHWSQPLTWITTLGCMTGSLTTGILANVMVDKGNFYPAGPLASQVQTLVENPRIVDSFCFLGLGLLGAALGIAIPAISRQITLARFRHIGTPHLKLAEAIFVGTVTAAARFGIIFINHQCTETNKNIDTILKPLESFDFSHVACPSIGTTSSIATTIFNPLIVCLRLLLHVTDPSAFSIVQLIGTLLFYLALTLLTHGIAVPSGLFAPIMLIGAATGRLCFLAVESFIGYPGRSIQMYAFVGAAAALGGVTRLSVSTTVLLLEASRVSMTYGLPCILSAFTAKFIADSFTCGIFDLAISMKGLPFFTSRILNPQVYCNAQVREIMSPQVVSVRTQCSVGELLDTLRTYSYSSFPVFSLRSTTIACIDDNGKPIQAGPATGPTKHLTETGVVENLSKVGKHHVAPEKTASGSCMNAEVPERIYVVEQPHVGKRGSTPAMVAILKHENGKSSSQTETKSGFLACDTGQDSSIQDLSIADGFESSAFQNADETSGSCHICKTRTQALEGTIARSYLIAIIDHCIGCFSQDRSWEWNSHALMREQFDSAWPHGEYCHRESDILAAVPTELRSMRIDLSRFCDANPLLVSDAATAADARTLFRITGARHALAVYTRQGRIVGIVTRTDLLEKSIVDDVNFKRSTGSSIL